MKRALHILVLLAAFASCKKPYTPKAISNPPHYLVVEGTILSGSDSTIFKLSRTVSLSSGTATDPVSGAQVIVESNTSAFSLSEFKPGYYFSPGQNLDPSQQYRLRIILADNTTYLSDYVPLKTTPPIDSIGFNVQNNGAQLYVNTHDPNNNTRYYRWEYEETWEFHSLYQSSFITNGIAIVPRDITQQIYYCYTGDISSSIFVSSSAKLSKDLIYQNPLAFIPSTSEKVEMKYSMLLKQYALTNDAFIFWTNLKKNTEQLGSIFDAQPSQINGNIHNIKDTTERVFGYVSACTVQAKRVFFLNTDFPGNWRVKYPYDCELDSLWFNDPRTHEDKVAELLIPLGSEHIPIAYFGTGFILGYLATDRDCTDCTIRGTLQPPSFWQ